MQQEMDRRAERERVRSTVDVWEDGRRAPCGKVGYSSQREADKALTRLVRYRAVRGFDPERIEIRSYRCSKEICVREGVPVFHLTSLGR